MAINTVMYFVPITRPHIDKMDGVSTAIKLAILSGFAQGRQ